MEVVQTRIDDAYHVVRLRVDEPFVDGFGAFSGRGYYAPGVGISVMGIFRDKKAEMSFMLVGSRNGRSICGGGTEAVAGRWRIAGF